MDGQSYNVGFLVRRLTFEMLRHSEKTGCRLVGKSHVLIAFADKTRRTVPGATWRMIMRKHAVRNLRSFLETVPKE